MSVEHQLFFLAHGCIHDQTHVKSNQGIEGNAFMQANHPHTPLSHPQKKTGVLLVNLGTPCQPTIFSVARYLRQFLSDKRVIQLSKLIWTPILYGIILPFRSRQSAKKYQSIWQTDSPLRIHTQNLCQHLANELCSKDPSLMVIHAMRYGKPSIEEAMTHLASKGCQSLIILPLFPQYSAVTSASVFDEVARVLKSHPYVPSLHFINSYHDHPSYIHAISQSLTQHWKTHGKGDHLLFSFHGLPQKQWQKGDPYHCLCQKTARLVAETLELSPDSYSVAFQSRLGPSQWLKPYTEDKIQTLAKQHPRLDVIAPSFLTDCLETLEEIQMEYQALFSASGGKKFSYIPALNDSKECVTCLVTLIQNQLCTTSSVHDKFNNQPAKTIGRKTHDHTTV